MNEINNKLLETCTLFTMHINYRVENLTINNHKIGSNIFLLNFINSNNKTNMKSIADFLDVIPSTATKKVDKLVKFGLVKRIFDETDRRNVYIVSTEKGEEISKGFIELKYSNIMKMFNELTEEERDFLLNIFEKIIAKKDDLPFIK